MSGTSHPQILDRFDSQSANLDTRILAAPPELMKFNLGFRGLGFRVLGFRGLGFRDLGFRV